MARLLFVDDDPYTLETLTKAVQLLGHQAYTAQRGEEAITLATVEKPDLIFTDMQLPDMLGIDLIAQLRTREVTNCIPMYVLSASPTVDAVERAEQAGAKAYINKPIRLQTLLDIIRANSAG